MSKVRISSRAAIKGHPVHPALIHFPIALLLVLVLTDIAFIVTRNDFWAEASFWLVASGLAYGIVSSIPGAIDAFSVREIRHIIAAWAHALLAVMTLSLATLNLMLRMGDNAGALIIPWGMYTSLLTALLINITGSVGAQLVFEYGIGVNVAQEDERQVKP